MASRKQLEDALIAAHENGDTEAASMIAKEITGNVPHGNVVEPQQYRPPISEEQLQRDMPLIGPRGVMKPSLWQKIQTTAPMPAITGAMDIANEGANLIEQGIGSLTGVDAIKEDAQRNVAAMGERERSYQLARKMTGNTQPDVGRAIGNIAANVAITPSFGTGGGMAAQMARGLAQGGVSGALSPVTDETRPYWDQKLGQVGTGAAIGAAVPAALGAASRIISPRASTNPNVQELLSRDVRLTPGQMLGGRMQVAEDKLASLPITGDAITWAKQRSWDDAHRAAVDWVGEPIDAAIPRDIRSGHQAVDYMSDRIDDAYNSVIPRLHIDANTVVQTMGAVGGDAAHQNILPQTQAERLADILRNQISKIDNTSQFLSGDEFKSIDSQLSSFMRGYGKSPDIDTQNLGHAIGDVRTALRDALAQQNPTYAPQLRAVDDSFARMVRVERAAQQTSGDGAFSPLKFDQSVRSLSGGARRGQAARGGALGQDLSSAMAAVLPSKYPDSGTAGRVMLGGGTLAGASAMGINPVAAGAGLAAAATPWLPGGRDVAEYAIARRPQAAHAIANALRDNPAMQRLPGASAIIARLLGQP